MKKIRLFFFSLFLFLVLPVFGQEVEINNLIFDQTKTQVGHQFHRQFAALWQWPPGFEDMNIFISEKQTGQYGNWLKVEVGGLFGKKVVYHKSLKPKEVKKEVLISMGAVRRFLAAHGYTGDDPDLKGNGI